jgi:hypothetical protein
MHLALFHSGYWSEIEDCILLARSCFALGHGSGQWFPLTVLCMCTEIVMHYQWKRLYISCLMFKIELSVVVHGYAVVLSGCWFQFVEFMLCTMVYCKCSMVHLQCTMVPTIAHCKCIMALTTIHCMVHVPWHMVWLRTSWPQRVQSLKSLYGYMG